MLLALLKWDLKNTLHGIMSTLLMIFYTIIQLLLKIKILIMVLTWPEIQYTIKVSSIIGL